MRLPLLVMMQMDGGSKDYRLIPVTDSCATKVLCEFVARGKHAVRKVKSHLTITHPRLVDILAHDEMSAKAWIM